MVLGEGKGGPQITDEPKVAACRGLGNSPRVSLCDAKQQTGISEPAIQRHFWQKLRVFLNRVEVGSQLNHQNIQEMLHSAD